MKHTTTTTSLNKQESTALNAALKYVARKNRTEHPDGKFDKANRWYPAAHEASPYVQNAREPSGAWPYSKLLAARSLKHCVWLNKADHTTTRDVVGIVACTPTKAGLKRLGKSTGRIIEAMPADLRENSRSAVLDKLKNFTSTPKRSMKKTKIENITKNLSLKESSSGLGYFILLSGITVGRLYESGVITDPRGTHVSGRDSDAKLANLLGLPEEDSKGMFLELLSKMP